MTLGEKIFKLRTEQGLSQETFGEKLGVSRQSVSKWETNQSIPELDKIVAVSELFGVSTDYLLKETEVSCQTEKEEWFQDEKLIREESAANNRRAHYEYRSKKMIGNPPLVHINVGVGLYRAKGVIAVGAVAQGGLAIGFVAMGGLAVGLVSLGLFAFATLAFGLLAFGSLAVGVISIGAFSFGIFFHGSDSIRTVRLRGFGPRGAGGSGRCGER